MESKACGHRGRPLSGNLSDAAHTIGRSPAHIARAAALFACWFWLGRACDENECRAVQPFEFFALEVRLRFGRCMLVNLADTHGPLRCAQVLFGAVLRGFETEFYSLKADVEKLILQIKKQMSLKVRGRRNHGTDNRV